MSAQVGCSAPVGLAPVEKRPSVVPQRPRHEDGLADLVSAYLEREGRSAQRIAQEAARGHGLLVEPRRADRPEQDLLIRIGRRSPTRRRLDLLLVAADYAPIAMRGT